MAGRDDLRSQALGLGARPIAFAGFYCVAICAQAREARPVNATADMVEIEDSHVGEIAVTAAVSA